MLASAIARSPRANSRRLQSPYAIASTQSLMANRSKWGLGTSFCLVHAGTLVRQPRASSRRLQTLYTIASNQSLMTSSRK